MKAGRSTFIEIRPPTSMPPISAMLPTLSAAAAAPPRTPKNVVDTKQKAM